MFGIDWSVEIMRCCASAVEYELGLYQEEIQLASIQNKTVINAKQDNEETVYTIDIAESHKQIDLSVETTVYK